MIADADDDVDAINEAIGDIEGIRNVEIQVADPTSTRGTTVASRSLARDDDPLDDNAPRLVADLELGMLTLRAVVPDEATATRIRAAADLTYAPFVDTDIEVVPDLDAAPWTERAHEVIALLPVVGTGTIDLVGDSLLLTSLSPNEAEAQRFVDAVGALTGLTPDETSISVTGLAPPKVSAVFRTGVLMLSGELSTGDVRDAILGSATTTFGADAVVDMMTVGEGLDTPFWSHRVPLTFARFVAFSDWEFKIENGVTSGTLRSGANFSVGSARLTAELKVLLEVAAGILSRDPSIALVIEGHTDSGGAAGENLALSTRRAEAAAEFLTTLGVEADRLDPIGYGESRPVANNGTADGRDTNRRVEFRFTTVGR